MKNARAGSEKRIGKMLLGRAYKPEVLKKGRFTKDHSLEEMKDFSLIIKLIYKAVIVFMKLRYKSHHGEKDPPASYDDRIQCRKPVKKYGDFFKTSRMGIYRVIKNC